MNCILVSEVVGWYKEYWTQITDADIHSVASKDYVWRFKQTKNVALLPFNYTQQKVVKVSTKATTAHFISLYQPKRVWL